MGASSEDWDCFLSRPVLSDWPRVPPPPGLPEHWSQEKVPGRKPPPHPVADEEFKAGVWGWMGNPPSLQPFRSGTETVVELNLPRPPGNYSFCVLISFLVYEQNQNKMKGS